MPVQTEILCGSGTEWLRRSRSQDGWLGSVKSELPCVADGLIRSFELKLGFGRRLSLSPLRLSLNPLRLFQASSVLFPPSFLFPLIFCLFPPTSCLFPPTFYLFPPLVFFILANGRAIPLVLTHQVLSIHVLHVSFFYGSFNVSTYQWPQFF